MKHPHEKKTDILAIRMEPEFLRALQRYAKKRGISVSVLVRQLIRDKIGRTR